MSTPLLSILCHTYNHKNFIKQALDGFLMQKTTFPFEIIIHDDASIDGTADVIHEYTKKYPHIIKPILQKENQYTKGVSIERDIVWPNIKGKYVAYCEGDDYWIDPYKLQKQVDFLEANLDYTICCHSYKQIHDDGTKDLIKPTPKIGFIKDFLTITFEDVKNCYELLYTARSCTVTYRWQKNEVISKFPTEIFAGDDFAQLIHLEIGKMAYFEDVMAVYRKHINGVTNGTKKDDVWFLNHGFSYANSFYLVKKQFSIENDYEMEELAKNTYQMALKYKRLDIVEKMKVKMPDLYNKVKESNET